MNKKLLQAFVEKYADARLQIGAWVAEIEEAKWDTHHQLKNRYPRASILKNRHVIFNICGNRYRLWVQISYKSGVVVIKNVGTHKEYDNWNID
ncbi:MAG: type II toxin-antitoxin system HigB family toxin [Oscillospiraceae bacterium]|nr:type II toxin-antitoxin system HigB family toxin [Oscillospiraceae bacterium]